MEVTARRKAMPMTTTHIRLMWVAVSLCAILALWFGASRLLVPESYYQVSRYTVMPTEVCPSAPVETRVAGVVMSYPYLERGRYQLFASWVNVGDGIEEKLPEAGGTLADIAPGEFSNLSPILRQAPTTPGLWRLRVEAVIHGSVLTWKREWRIFYESEDMLRVYYPAAKECNP